MLILGTLFIMGCLLGLTGAGGAGIVIAILTAAFGVPIHLALGTSLGAMAFTTLSGAVSHFREGNVRVRTGAAVGAFGAIGSFLGAHVAALIPSSNLHWLTGGMLLLSMILMYLRLYHPNSGPFAHATKEELRGGSRFWFTAVGAGLVVGFLSGTFGIGATPFIQLSLLILFDLPLVTAVGTTMLIIMPIAVFGGLGYLLSGNLDFTLFFQVVAGLMTGAYVGATFTNRIPRSVLKVCMTSIPGIGALILFLE